MAALESLIKDLRALVVSAQGGLTVAQLKRDYQEINGGPLVRACSQAGYDSVESLIAKNPRELRLANGIVLATLKESSAHVQQLVNQQQRKRVKPRKGSQFLRPKPMSFAPPRRRAFPKPIPTLPPRLQAKKLPPLMPPQQPQHIECAKKIWPKELFVNGNNNQQQNTQSIQNRAKPRAPQEQYHRSNGAPPKPPPPELSETGGSIFKDIRPLDALIPNGKPSVDFKTEFKPPRQTVVKFPEQDENENKNDVHGYLLQLCAKLGYDKPDYKVMSITSTGGDKTLWTCMVRVGGETFRGGVVDSAATARNLAASAAYSRLSAYEVAVKPAESENLEKPNEEFVEQLIQFLKAKQSGVWMNYVSELIKNECNIDVPKNWRELVNAHPDDFEVTWLCGQELLKPVKKTVVNVPTSTPTKFMNDTIDTESPDYFDFASIKYALKKVPEIDLNVNDVIDVHVLSFVGHDTVIVRLIDDYFEDKYNDMITAMELKLMDKQCKLVKKPIAGNFYAVCCNEMIFRGMFESIEPDGTAIVYDIDGGERENVPLDKIYELEDQYYEMESQALRFRLDGLMNFPPVDKLSSLMEPLPRKAYVGIVRELFDDDKSRGIIELYDTSKDPNVNLNLMLMEEVVNDLATFSMQPDSVHQLRLSHIEDNAVYLQCMDNSIDCISSLIEYNAERVNLLEHKVKKILCDKIYYAMHPITNKLQRIRVTGFAEKLEVLFIDHGDSIEIDRDDVFDLPSNALVKAPPRACKVAIFNIDTFNPSQIHFMKTTLIGKEMMVKTRSVTNLPSVELYWREPKKALMQSVNKVLAGLPKDLTTALPEVSVPSVNSQLYVTVVLTVDPTSFKVLVKEDLEIFNGFMEDLQQIGLDDQPVLDTSAVKIGDYFAVKYNGAWFRGKVDAILCEDEFCVRLIDEGNIVSLSLDKLRELPDEFRKYPVFLRQATLHGVQPAMGDWSPSDCVNFQNLLADKELFAIVKDVQFLEDGTPVLALQLIDTSDPDIDVYVHEKLISDGVAVAI